MPSTRGRFGAEHKGEGSTVRNEGTRMDTTHLVQLSSVIYVRGSEQGFDEKTLVKKEKDKYYSNVMRHNKGREKA